MHATYHQAAPTPSAKQLIRDYTKRSGTAAIYLLTYLLTYLLMPVFSLGAWAIDQTSPQDPALRQGDNFLPGVPHLPHFRFHVSPPSVSWSLSFPLPLGVPCQCLSCDARCRYFQRVTNPTPFSSFYFYFYWQLISLGPHSYIIELT